MLRSPHCRILVVLAITLVAVAAFAAPTSKASRAAEVRKAANVRHTGRYVINSPPATVRAAFSRPRVMAALWLAYAYDGPAYAVTPLREPGAVHVVDPTGIEGDVWPVSGQSGQLTYLADGKVNHWAVPLMNTGVAVFDVGLSPSGTGTQATVNVSLKADSKVAGAALWILTPLVKARVESRLKNNLAAMGKILEHVASEPAKVSPLLQGDLRREFDRAFLARVGESGPKVGPTQAAVRATTRRAGAVAKTR